MYDAPFDTLTRLGWTLAGVVIVLLAARAVRVERRHVHPDRRTAVRVLDVGLNAVATLAVLAFLAVLVLVVLSGLDA